MTFEQKLEIKLKILKHFEGFHFSLVEAFEIFDELKGEISNKIIEKELKKLKFKEK